MSLGEVNKGAVVLILVLVFGAAGYLWYTQMYKPAVAERVTALSTKQTAETELTAAKSDLAAAQQRIEASKQDSKKTDDSVQRVQVARGAVPNEKAIDDAAIVLMDLAQESGIRTTFSASEDPSGSSTPVAGPEGTTPIDLTFHAAGTYPEMMLFMRNVEGTVDAKRGKIYAHGRLFNVVKLEIGTRPSEESGSSSFPSSDSGSGDENALVARPGEMLFTVTIRMYTSSTKNAQGVGAATPDAAAAPVDGAASGSSGTGTTDSSTSGTGTSSSAGASDQGSSAANTTGSSTSTGTGSTSTPTTAGAPTGG